MLQNNDNSYRKIFHIRFTCLHQERVYTCLGISCLQCVHDNTIEMHICMRMKQLDWCTHRGQEIPKQVYALSWCKPVDSGVVQF